MLFNLCDGFIRILADDNQGSCYLITYIAYESCASNGRKAFGNIISN